MGKYKYYPSHTDDALLQKFNILSINEYMRYQTLIFVFKTLKFGAPATYLNSIFHFNKRSNRQLLVMPSHNYKIRESCISYEGTKLWNSLPCNLRDINLSVAMVSCKINDWLLNCRNSDFTV